MRRITLLNSKGGCGKTTLATNLASFYASSGLPTVLIDHDAQGSSTRWLGVRPDVMPPIHGIAAYRQPIGVTRSFHHRLPAGTQRIIVDTPASIEGPALQDLVRLSDCIVIPVLSSHIDIDALEKFTQQLRKDARVRTGSVRVAVVANRARKSTRIFRELSTVLEQCPFDYVTLIRESQNYVTAGELGVGIHDLKPTLVHKDCPQWEPLLGWLDEPRGPNRQPADDGSESWPSSASMGPRSARGFGGEIARLAG